MILYIEFSWGYEPGSRETLKNLNRQSHTYAELKIQLALRLQALGATIELVSHDCHLFENTKLAAELPQEMTLVVLAESS